MVGTLVRTGSFLVRSGRLRSGHGTKCLETFPSIKAMSFKYPTLDGGVVFSGKARFLFW